MAETTANSLPNPELKENYRWFLPLTTRWMDNDIYGHINNVQYYAYFDTIANTYLIEHCGLDIRLGEIIGYIVHSECNYKRSAAFPDQLEGGLRINKLGNSSVQYGVAVFKKGETSALAFGHFTHVFVTRTNERPVSIPEQIRNSLKKIAINEQ